MIENFNENLHVGYSDILGGAGNNNEQITQSNVY